MSITRNIWGWIAVIVFAIIAYQDPQLAVTLLQGLWNLILGFFEVLMQVVEGFAADGPGGNGGGGGGRA